MIISSKELLDRLSHIQYLDFNSYLEHENELEEIFYIDLNTRVINVPEKFKSELAIKGDHKAETIWFALNRYFDGHDLLPHGKDVDKTTEGVWAVQVQNAAGKAYLLPVDEYVIPQEGGKYPLKGNKTVSHIKFDEDEFLLGWAIPRDVTEVAGNVSLSLRYFKFNTDDTDLIYNIGTKPITMRVADTMYFTENTESITPKKSTLETLVAEIQSFRGDDGTIQIVNYDNLKNLPKINNVELKGNTTINQFDIVYYQINEQNELVPHILGQDVLTIDTVVNASSRTNPVTGKAIYDFVGSEVQTVNETINTKVALLDEKISSVNNSTISSLNSSIATVKSELNTAISTNKTNIETNKRDIGTLETNLTTEIANAKSESQNYTNTEITKVNQTITTSSQEDRAYTDTEVAKINTSVSGINTKLENFGYRDLKGDPLQLQVGDKVYALTPDETVVIEQQKIEIDEALGNTENPVQNKVIKTEIDKLWGKINNMAVIPLKVLSFAVKPQYVEKNSVFNETAVFNWELDGAIATQVLKQGSTEKPINNPDDRTYSWSFADSNLTDTTEFTLTVTDNQGKTVSANTSIIFTYKVFYGASSAADAYDIEFLQNLGNGKAQETSAMTFTAGAGSADYIYYAAPQSYGVTRNSFSVGGFTGGFGATPVATIEYNGVNYDIWKSDNTNLGDTTVTVV